MIVYKSARKVELLVPSLEAAAAAADPSSDLYLQLFAIYLRTGDLVKQQQTAMKLSKLQQSAPESQQQEQQDGQKEQHQQASYIWWAIMSMVLQARAALTKPSSSLNTAQLLKLAGSMISRHVSFSSPFAQHEDTIARVLNNACPSKAFNYPLPLVKRSTSHALFSGRRCKRRGASLRLTKSFLSCWMSCMRKGSTR